MFYCFQVCWIVLWLLLSRILVSRSFLYSDHRSRLPPRAETSGMTKRRNPRSNEAEKCPKSRCARFQTNICCNYLDYFWPMQAAIDASMRTSTKSLSWRRLPWRLCLLRSLLHGFPRRPIVSEMPPRSAAPPISAMNSNPNRHFFICNNAIIHFFIKLWTAIIEK